MINHNRTKVSNFFQSPSTPPHWEPTWFKIVLVSKAPRGAHNRSVNGRPLLPGHHGFSPTGSTGKPKTATFLLMLSCHPQVGQGHVANGTRENVWPRSGLQSPLFAMGVLSLLTLRLRLTRCINWPDLRHSTSSSSYCSVAHGLLTVDVWDVLDWRTLAEQQACRSEKSTTWRNTRNWEWFPNIYLLIYRIKLVWI